MKVCDICNEPSGYERWATIDAKGISKKIDLCGKCYSLLCSKLDKHNFLAYQETVEEVTGKAEDKTWLKKYLGFWR